MNNIYEDRSIFGCQPAAAAAAAAAAIRMTNTNQRMFYWLNYFCILYDKNSYTMNKALSYSDSISIPQF